MRIRLLSSSVIAAILVASVAGSAAARPAAVPTTRAASTPVTLAFWNYWDGNNGKAIQKLVDRFNRTHPNIRVKNVTFPWGDLFTKMQAASAGSGDNLPAVAAGDIAWMAALHRSKRLVDLGPTATRAKLNLKDFYPEILKYSRFNGKLQALPVSTNNLALFFNKDLFKRAGLDPAKPPTTWTQLREYAMKIAALGGGVQGFEIYTQPGEGLTWQLQPYIWQAGGNFLNADNTKPAFNTPAGRRALGFLVDLIQKDKVTEAGQWGAFDKGQTGMRVDGSWMVGVYKDQAPFSFGTAMIPRPEGGKPATNMGGEQIFVFRRSGRENSAAATFALWLASTPVQAEWDVATNFMPVRASVARHKLVQSYIKREPRLKAFVKQQQYARARPPVPQYPAVSDAFSKAIEPAFYGRISVNQALANAARDVQAVLSGR